MKKQHKEVTRAKAEIKKMNKVQLIYFIGGCAMDGLIKIDANTPKKTIQALRLVAYAAVDNLQEKIEKGEITAESERKKEEEKLKAKTESKLILPSEQELIKTNTNRFRYVGDT